MWRLAKKNSAICLQQSFESDNRPFKLLADQLTKHHLFGNNIDRLIHTLDFGVLGSAKDSREGEENKAEITLVHCFVKLVSQLLSLT